MPEEHSKAKLDAMMDKVRKLLARADHPGTPAPEAASSRDMAERIMVKYRIEEEALIESGDLKTDVIDVQMVVWFICPIDSEFKDAYRKLASYALNHTGCKGVYFGYEYIDGVANLKMNVFGYEADLMYSEMLFNSARILFADRMEPKPKPELSDADNVYRMRSAGMERIRISAMMGWGTTNSATAKVTRFYKAACAARGEDAALTGRGNSVVNFRDVYQDEFVTTFFYRLLQARNAIEAEIDGGLVLHNREDRINERLYQEHPTLRPNKEALKLGSGGGLTDAQRRAASRRADRDWQKTMQKRSSAAGRAGAAAGKRAAEEVNIKGQTPKRRLEN